MYLFRRALFRALVFMLPLTMAGACSADTEGSLAGVWMAQETLTPTQGGTVRITQAADDIRATLGEEVVDGATEGEWHIFTFSGGVLRSPVEHSDTMTGFWVQPPRAANGTAYATPVHLAHEGDNWSGAIEPLADDFTIYLSVEETTDGQRIFIRNPDRNIGLFVELTALTQEDSAVTLSGHFRGDEGETYPLATGTRTSDDSMTLTFPSLEQTYHFTRLDDGDRSGFFPGGRPDAAYTYEVPISRNDGWPVADAPELGVDPAQLEELVRAIYALPQDGPRVPYPHAILVARHGHLIFEEYFHGFDAEVAHDERSSSKSVSTTMVGLVQQAGVDLPLGSGVYAALGMSTEGDPRRANLTLRDLMTMSSGLDCDDNDSSTPGNEDVMQNQEDEPNWWRYALQLDMVRDPGAEAVYCSAGMNLVGGVLAARTGEWLPALVDERLARPLGFGTYHVNLMPTGEAYFGGGMHVRPRDFLKLGQLMLGDGMWQGERLLPEGWAEAATTPYFPMNNQHYGYGWWLIDYAYGNGRVDAYYSGGNGGQMVIVVPALDLVVMVNAGNYSDFAALLALRDDFVGRYIVPAVTGD